MGDLDTKEGIEGQKILDCTVPWTEKVYDWTDAEIDAYINSRGKDCNGIFYIEYQYYQIGLNQKWLQKMSAKIGNPLVVRRELLLQRLHGSSLSPFDQEVIQYIVETKKNPIDELWLLDFFKFDIYEPLNKSIPYLVGVDNATGTDSDNNAITIIDPYSLKPVAEFECSYIGETKYVKLIIELVQEHIPKAVLCIERNSMGDSIIDALMNSPIRGNIYYDRNKDLEEEKMEQNQTIESMLKKEARKKIYYGVWTGAASRDTMMKILARHVEEYKDKFITNNIIRDLSRLVRTNTGKIVAGPGFHDDSIMSYLMCLYVYYLGNNLMAFGILKGMKDEEMDNSGLKTADEINPAYVNPALIQQVREQEQIQAQKSYEEILRSAVANAQKESAVLRQHGLSSSRVLDNSTADNVYDDDNGTIPMDLFDALNGF